MNSRTCPACQHAFPRTPTFWHRNKTRGDGLQLYCKPCQRYKVNGGANLERSRERCKAYNASHLEERRVYDRMVTRERNTEARRARHRVSSKAYYERNRAAIRLAQRAQRGSKTEAQRAKDAAYSASYYERHLVQCRAKLLAYRWRNIDKIRAQDRARAGAYYHRRKELRAQRRTTDKTVRCLGEPKIS